MIDKKGSHNLSTTPRLCTCTPIHTLHSFDAVLECEAPNSRIHTYTGTLEWQGRRIPVDQAHLLLRGSTLRNTKWALGLVVYTGYDTKVLCVVCMDRRHVTMPTTVYLRASNN